MKRVTIKDIAREAGTSYVTVSHYLNKRGEKFSVETAARIEAAIKKLGYIPNRAARKLARRRSYTIGIVLPPAPEDILPASLLRDNPFYNEFVAGVQARAWEYDTDVVLTGYENDEGVLEWILSYQLDGVIFFSSEMAKKIREEAKRKRLDLQTIFIGLDVSTDSVDASVTIDEASGIMQAVSHLVGLGHRRIALATGDYHTSPVNAARYAAYKQALTEANLLEDQELVLVDEVSLEGGKRIGERLLPLMKNHRVSAVVCVADILAAGIYKTLLRAGKRMPDDLSITGFDDLFIATLLEPELTTVKQDVARRAALCVDLIEGFYQGKTLQSLQMPVELVLRHSTAPYKHAR
ncbi:Transcriptional regulator, LacI family [Brevinematales bacterium NS]|nr:Transcriptional regulator, LacI family [Brevinematales bacterium NS]